MARILIIEDNAVNMQLMVYLLTAFGHSVLEAPDGQSGLALVQAQAPDLILCDLQLPDIHGFEVVRQIKAMEGAAGHTPVVAVTALAMVGDRDQTMTAGFDGYISKPIEPQLFVGQVEGFLRTAPPAPSAST